MNPHSYFLTLARYNLWATRKLFDEHLMVMSEADYRRDCGLFFKSIHLTMNHLVAMEHELWFRRFAEGISPQVAYATQVEVERQALRERALAGAQRWAALITGWDAARFDDGALLNYTTMRGFPASIPFAATLGHVFNHGTHHRGQVTAALTAMGYAGPELDLVFMLQAEHPAP